ncbi:MAG: hypothetical protein AB7G52_08480 [Arcobacter sp.]
MDLVTGGLIDLEIRDIIKSSNNKTNNLEYDIYLHTPDKDIFITLINTIEILRDYNGNISDYIVTNFIMYSGDFIKDVIPYKDNLELTIVMKIVGEETKYNRYKFVITNNTADIYGSKYTKLSKDELNKSEQFVVEGQCVIREVEALRTFYVDGIYKNTDVKSLIVSELINTAKESRVEGTTIPIQVDMREPNNDMQYNHINVPTGTKYFDLPTFLQNTTYGVYNGSIGTYFQRYKDNNIVFVYPLYDIELFSTSTKKLILYHANTHKLDHVENTYMVDGDIVKILCGNNITNVDNGENELINSGDGLVNTNTKLIMSRNAIVTDDKLTLDKDTHLTGKKMKDKRDGVTKSNYVGNEVNMYKHRSLVNRNTMAVYQIPWNFCDIELLYPGMPVCFMYEDEKNGIVKLNGVLQSVYSRYNNTTKTTSGIINVMVMKPNVYLNEKGS